MVDIYKRWELRWRSRLVNLVTTGTVVFIKLLATGCRSIRRALQDAEYPSHFVGIRIEQACIWIVRECSDATRLLDDMLTLARFDAGHTDTAFTRLNIAKVQDLDSPSLSGSLTFIVENCPSTASKISELPFKSHSVLQRNTNLQNSEAFSGI